MALIKSTAIPSGATDYELEQSLRFNDPDSPELEKTFGTATNRKKWTWSGWYKVSLGHGNDSNPIVVTEDGQAQNTLITFGGHNAADDALSVIDWSSTAEKFQLVTTSLFRDPSAWYNIVVAYDSTQSTSSNRLKIYVNGEQVTVFTYSVYPPLNYESYLNSAVVTQIGHNASRSGHFHGYMAETNFIDGQQLTSADFGETGDYGEWKPIDYSGTYGTNGFHLNFTGGGVMSATGGNTITTDGDYKVHTFTSNGTFTPTITGVNKSNVEYLVIAGGGGGGHSDGSSLRGAGGGGAGGYKTGDLSVTSGTGYSITVGAGGSGGSGAYDGAATAGANSVFSSITSTGGGGGKGHSGAADNSTGGSGGGGSWLATSGGSASPAGQGNAGGTGGDSHPNHGGGGGGGAGAAGSNANHSIGQGGNGGAGLASSITGSSVTRAGGGGGGGNSDNGEAGSGGGGAGQTGTSQAGASHGTANTGGGGGGAADGSDYGGNGGSGIVIIRYKFN